MEMVKRWQLSQRVSNKRVNTKLTPLPVDPCKLYCTPHNVRSLCLCLVEFLCAIFLRNLKLENPG